LGGGSAVAPEDAFTATTVISIEATQMACAQRRMFIGPSELGPANRQRLTAYDPPKQKPRGRSVERYGQAS
jgi:hypothetical protein